MSLRPHCIGSRGENYDNNNGFFKILFLSRLSVGILFVPAKSDIPVSHQLLGPRPVFARSRDAEIPVPEIHRRSLIAGPDVVHFHGGVAQLHLHGHQHHQSDIGGKRDENEGKGRGREFGFFREGGS